MLHVSFINFARDEGKMKQNLSLEVGGSPMVVFKFEFVLDPRNGNGGPYTSPEEGENPANNIGNVSINGKNDCRCSSRAHNSANSPEEGQAVQHFAEVLACLIAKIKALAELGTSRSVHGADVLNVGVDARAQGCTNRKRGDATWRGNFHDAKDVDEQELTADDEQHGGGRHGEETNGRVARRGAGYQFDHDKEPAKRQIPVKPVQIPSLGANDAAVGLFLPQPVEAYKVLDNRHGSKQRCANAEHGVGRQLVARQTIPHAKVKADGHKDTINHDEEPKPKDCLLARSQRVAQRWRAEEIGVFVSYLRVRVLREQAGRGSSARAGAGGNERGRGAAWLSLLIVLDGPIDVDARGRHREVVVVVVDVVVVIVVAVAATVATAVFFCMIGTVRADVDAVASAIAGVGCGWPRRRQHLL